MKFEAVHQDGACQPGDEVLFWKNPTTSGPSQGLLPNGSWQMGMVADDDGGHVVGVAYLRFNGEEPVRCYQKSARQLVKKIVTTQGD